MADQQAPTFHMTEAQRAEVQFMIDRGLADRNRPITEDDLSALETFRYRQAGKPTPAERYQRIVAAHNDWKTGRGKKTWKAQNDAFKTWMGRSMGAPRVDELQLNALIPQMAMGQRDVSPLPASVYTTPSISSLSVQYANEDYIGEELLNVAPSQKQTGNYFTYPQRERMQYPDDRMGSRGKAKEIHETRVQRTYNCEPFGFSDHVDAMTLANQDAPLNEMEDATASIAEGLLFRRELRIATTLCTVANYGANTWVQPAGTAWNSAGGGNPIADLHRLDAMLFSGHGPGSKRGFTSLGGYNVLSRHPMILQLYVFNNNSPGLATPDMLAKFFGWERLLVGRARQDAAMEGAAVAWARIWEPAGAFFFGLVKVASGSIRNAGFSTLFRMGNPISTTVYEPLSGHGGGYTTQISVCETGDINSQGGPVIIAPACGGLIQAPWV